jgi:hypothetical protein
MQYTEAELIDLWEQIAAIREYDGEMTREDAEQAAYFDWRVIVGNVPAPEAMRDSVRKFKGKEE